MATMHERRFTVRGRGEFPIDMLRYDRCWPRTGEDVLRIEPSYTSRGDLSTREVTLYKYTQLKRGSVAEAGRWRSFGWEVITED